MEHGCPNESLLAECAACAGCVLSEAAPALGGPTPYEVHATVASAEVGAFREACEALGVKPLLLALQLADGGVASDVMTSSSVTGGDADARREAGRVADGLAAAGFDVTRLKIETAPWHPAARAPLPGQYFESHLAIRCLPGRRDELSLAAAGLGLHLSRNAFKGADGSGREVVMATARSSGVTVESFKNRAEAARSALERAGFAVDKTIVEFALADTRVSLDDAWVGLAA